MTALQPLSVSTSERRGQTFQFEVNGRRKTDLRPFFMGRIGEVRCLTGGRPPSKMKRLPQPNMT